jgi:hypothetical protein
MEELVVSPHMADGKAFSMLRKVGRREQHPACFGLAEKKS